MKIRRLGPRNKQIPDSPKSQPFGNNTKLKVWNKILNLNQIQHSEFSSIYLIPKPTTQIQILKLT